MTPGSSFVPFDKEVDHFCSAAGHSSHRISEADHIGIVCDARSDEKIDLTDHYEACEHTDHGSFGVSASAQGTGKYMVDGIEDKEKCVHPQEQHAIIDHGFIA